MGNCCSWCKEDETNINVEQERTHLLVDPACNNTSVQRVVPEDYHYGSTPKHEDNAGVNKIYEEITTSIIDVGAVSNCIDHQEALERQNFYTSKLQSVPLSSVTNTIFSLRQSPACLLKDIPGPEKILSKNIGLPENYRGIMIRVHEIQRLLSNLSVEHRGDLVVKF